MSKFNLTLKEPKTLTTNLAGGQAYTQSPELELISILLNSFVDDQFYRSSNVTLDRLKTILDKSFGVITYQDARHLMRATTFKKPIKPQFCILHVRCC